LAMTGERKCQRISPSAQDRPEMDND
jgi:hypothetical protein